MQRLGVGHGFGGAADFRFRDDFQQRRAGAVQVDAAHARIVFMQRFTGVFFQVGARQVDRLGDEFAILFVAEGQGAADDDGVFELADLVALGRVRIKIVLAREDRVRRHGGAHGQTEADRAVDGRQFASNCGLMRLRFLKPSCSPCLTLICHVPRLV